MISSSDAKNYSEYLSQLSLVELRDIENLIDKEKYPEKYQLVLDHISTRQYSQKNSHTVIMPQGPVLYFVSWFWTLAGCTMILLCVRGIIIKFKHEFDVVGLAFLLLSFVTTFAGWNIRKHKTLARIIIIICSIISILYCSMFLLIVGTYWGKFFAILAIVMLIASLFSAWYLIDYHGKEQT